MIHSLGLVASDEPEPYTGLEHAAAAIMDAARFRARTGHRASKSPARSRSPGPKRPSSPSTATTTNCIISAGTCTTISRPGSPMCLPPSRRSSSARCIVTVPRPNWPSGWRRSRELALELRRLCLPREGAGRRRRRGQPGMSKRPALTRRRCWLLSAPPWPGALRYLRGDEGQLLLGSGVSLRSEAFSYDLSHWQDVRAVLEGRIGPPTGCRASTICASHDPTAMAAEMVSGLSVDSRSGPAASAMAT